MESVKKTFKLPLDLPYQKLTETILKGLNKGTLKVTPLKGSSWIVGEGDGFNADIQILSPDFYRKIVLFGDVGFGEAFCDGDWTTSNLTELIRFMVDNVENSGFMSGSKIKKIGMNLFGLVNKVGHKIKKNSKLGSKSNISYHYDLSNNFYELMLDSTMSYSCGIFADEKTSLHEAQLAKLDQVCADLDIKDGDHILEIGCGWGGLALHALSKYDCKFTCITISKEQFNYFSSKIEERGLKGRVTLLLQDYRDLDGQFDKVVSIEMIEAVGDQYLPQYFQTIDRLLKPQGVAVVQAITSPDCRFEEFKKGVDFIQKHIFPGSLCPSVGAMVGACQEKTNLHLFNLRDIGGSYGKTLRCWRENVKEKREEIEKLGMDEVFFRKWNFYLSYCEAAFLERNISDVQMTFIKPNNTTYKYTEI